MHGDVGDAAARDGGPDLAQTLAGDDGGEADAVGRLRSEIAIRHLHWAACCANYEVLLLAKRYGIDAQAMREVLLDCPGSNVTLERWDGTRFTWHEKDMDVALDLAQTARLTLPLFGHVDQLIKTLGPDKVKDLLYGPAAEYLGVAVAPMDEADGGFTAGSA